MSKFLWAGIITIVSLFSSHSLKAQFSDNFTDGDFTADPVWSASDKFVVLDGELKLQAPATSGKAFLSIASEAINDANWEFTVRLEFNPSGSNYARVYLTSDQPDLSGSLNGYFVLVGGSPDEVSLYRQIGTTTIKLIDGEDGRVATSSVLVRVKVTRDEEGKWDLFSDVGVTGTYTVEGTVNDTVHPSSLYAGVYCVYTSTRSDKFFFDDFVVTGNPWVDNTIPPAAKDIIITEIFADPSPVVELPEVEFVELYNRSVNEYNLSNWLITDGSSAGYLTNKVIKPGEYLILTTTASASLLSKYGEVMGVASFPSLNNSGDVLILKAYNGLTVDSVNYSDSWYHQSEKKQGGYTLELIDPNNPCGEENNWTSSEDETGGTPGRENSVHANKPDLTGPELVSAIPLSAKELKLVFNEKLADTTPSPDSFTITPAADIFTVSFADAGLRTIKINLADHLQSGILYQVKCHSVYDCNGNEVQLMQGEFGLPEPALPGDVVVNEILFNPAPLGVDFVEVYNASSKFFNLRGWKLANVENDSIINEREITDSDVLFHPQSFMVFTSDVASLKGQHPAGPENTFFQTTIPSFPDDEGSIALLSASEKLLDHFIYDEKMHSTFIKDEEGVSLERISVSVPTNDWQNWKSASSTVGYATPGYVNSNTISDVIGEEAITINPEIFQPLSGQPDFTTIQYRFDQGGYVANVAIYDVQGRKIKELANNDVLGSEGFYRWDGDRDDGSKARRGYYVVWFEVFNAEGIVKTYRKRVVVASAF